MKLPDGWALRRIDELGEVLGGRQRSSKIIRGRPIPYLRVANVMDGWIDTKNVLEMPFTEKEIHRYRLLPGDILLNEGQSLELVGRSAIYRGEPPTCCFQNTLIRFRPNQETAGSFAQSLFRWLASKGRFAAIASRTTSIAHLGVKRLASLKVALPVSHAEQDSIGEILTGFDTVSQLLKSLGAAKNRLKRGVMQELLTGKRRFKDFDGTPWRECTIGELLEVASCPVEWDDSATYDLLSLRRRSGGVFHRSRTKGEQIKTKQLFEVRSGDFLISKMQVLHGALGLVRPKFDGMKVSGSYVVLRNRVPDSLRIEFFDHLSRLPQMYRLALLSSYGVHIEKMTFNLEWYLRAKIRVPQLLAEHTAIVETLDALDREIHLLQQLRHVLDCQRRGLADLLLTGKLRVTA